MAVLLRPPRRGVAGLVCCRVVGVGLQQQVGNNGVAMAMGDVAIIPLYQMTNFWAARRGVTYEATGYDYTRLTQARLAR